MIKTKNGWAAGFDAAALIVALGLTAAVSLPGGKVRLDGKCSRLDVTFGCQVRIGNTPRGPGVVAREEVPPSLCVD